MRYPRATLIVPVILAMTLSRAAALQAQGPIMGAVSQTAAKLDDRSRERVAEWRQAAPSIHCGPAPLTERPGSAAELARPRVLPLEAAFLDAAIVRRGRTPGTHPALATP